MLIVFTHRRTSREKLEEIIRSEAARLGLEVRLSEPEFEVKQRLSLSRMAGDGFERRSSGGVVNAIPPELIDVAIKGVVGGAAAAVGAGTVKVTAAAAKNLFDAVAAAVGRRGLAKAEHIDDDTPGYL